jgi:hypothetical protein
MNAQAKPTPGPWKADRTTAPKGWVITGRDSSYDIAIVRDGNGNRENEANAVLIEQAGSVFDETGLMPRQLADQRKRLIDEIEALAGEAETAASALNTPILDDAIFNARRAVLSMRCAAFARARGETP